MGNHIPLQKSNNTENEHRLVILLWHIERYDKLRATIANKAAIILSANALLLTGTAFLFDKFFSTTDYSIKHVFILGGSGLILIIL